MWFREYMWKLDIIFISSLETYLVFALEQILAAISKTAKGGKKKKKGI